MGQAALLLGSNVGDRLGYLEKARFYIEKRAGKILDSSSLYETAAWGITDQPSFINQALLIETEIKPDMLLPILLDIEKLLGRERMEKWGPRIIDVDILYYDDVVMNVDYLKIPHPFLQERRFSLVPLNEISPAWIHPVLKLSVSEMLNNCKDISEVLKYSEIRNEL